MMRHTRKCILITTILALSLALAIPVLAQVPPKGGALMPMDVFTPITKGYDLIRDGKYDAARYEFAKAAKRDKFNPFALNNMAVLDERSGKLNDAMAHLKDATLHAEQYKDKVAQTCFVGGGCMAVEPTRQAGTTSTIAPIIQENIQKLQAKIAATGTPPPPGSPPPMSPAPKAK
jgi:hypothetical protein